MSPEDLRAVPLPAQNFPAFEEVVFITRFDEAVEVMRSPHFKKGVGSRSIRVAVDAERTRILDSAGFVEGAEAADMMSWDVFLRSGDLHHTEGEEHVRLRRTFNPLFGRDAHLWFRDHVIGPAVERNLGASRARPGADGLARVDLVQLSKRIYIQAAAALVGYDGAQDDVGADALISLHTRIEGNADVARNMANGPAVRERMQQVIDGIGELRERFYRPSLARRRALLDRRRSDPSVEMPHDLLSIVARDDGQVLHDENAGFANAMSFLNGAIGTNTQLITSLFAALATWFAAHPEDIELRNDGAFLGGALQETIRLNGPGGAAFSRIALRDVVLASGRRIAAGQYAAVVKRFANRDREAYGPNADEFDPRRTPAPGVYAFGIGFGSGPHMCIGLPLVLGQGGISGMQVPVIQALYAAGARPDPQRPAQKRTEVLPWQDEYAVFPIILDPRG